MDSWDETEKENLFGEEPRVPVVCYGLLDETLNWVSPDVVLRSFLGGDTIKSLPQLAGESGDAVARLAREAKTNGVAEGWMNLASAGRKPGEGRLISLELVWQPEVCNYAVCMMDMAGVNREFPALYGRKQAYRRLIQEQHLPAFSYNPTLDDCRVIDPATGRAVPLEKATTAALAGELKKAVHTAATTGMSFFRRMEDGGTVCFCVGMVNSRGGQVFSVEGLILKQSKAGNSPAMWGRRQEDRDSFTGLYNKVSSMEYARSIIANNDGTQVYLCMIDLDHFKAINDVYGHEFGDEVIAKAAQIFEAAVQGMGIAGRFGGDEFFLVLHKTMTEEQVRDFLRGVRDRLGQAFVDSVHPVTVTCSVGVAQYPANGSDFDHLFAKADCGLYIAKRKGRNRYILYKEAIHGELAPGAEFGIGEAAMAAVNISKVLAGTKKEIARLYRKGSQSLPGVLKEICLLYRFESVSIYYGRGLPHILEIGANTDPIPSMEALQTEEVLSLFDKDGMCRANLNQFHSHYLEEYHGLLAAHDMTQSVTYLFGEQEANRGAIIFYNRNVKNGNANMASDEELHLLGMVAAAVGDIL